MTLRHAAKIRGMLYGVITHAREDLDRIDDPDFKSLFETTAEVLLGLSQAYEHAEQRSEPAWK